MFGINDALKQIIIISLVFGVKEELRLAPWLRAGEGGGMLGGVVLVWVFTSAGESGIVMAVR